MVRQLKYLGSTYCSNGTMDKEISLRLAAASGVASHLYKGVWRNRRIGLRTKLMFYRCAVLTVLLYGAECWTLTAPLVQRLEVFHQRWLRCILRIRFWQHVSNVEVFARSNVPPIAFTMRQRRLTWLGHVGRMDDERLVKRLLFGQQDGARRRGAHGGLRRTYAADVLALHGGHPNGQSWYSQCQSRSEWHRLVAAMEP